MKTLWTFILLIVTTVCGCMPRPTAEDAIAATDQARRINPPERPLAAYCDDNVCRDCHADIDASYQSVAMAQSFSKFDAATAIEEFSGQGAHFFHVPSNMHFEMEVHNGRMKVSRYRQRDDGTRVAVRQHDVDYVIGSGNHVRGYLYGNPSGELYEMPIVWYAQRGSWGMAPGYDLADHEDFDRPITRQCMACHNAFPDYRQGDDTVGQRDLFTGNLPHGIGCQRCHGPAAEHVRLASSESGSVEQTKRAIVNPSRLTSPQREDVCLQCHLQPMSRRTSIVRKSGLGDYGFRPGDLLSDHVAYFEFDEGGVTGDGGQREDLFEINHHPYRLFQSSCFLKSGGELSCVTCHNPHEKVAPAKRAQHYRQQCLRCHGPADCLDAEQAMSSDADCVACHMPTRRTQDVVHVVMTDHRIGRHGNLADLVAPLPEREIPSTLPIRQYWPWPIGQRVELPELGMIARLRDRDYTAIADLTQLESSTEHLSNETLLELSQAQLQSGALDEAELSLRELLNREFAVSLVATNLGTVMMTARNYEDAIGCFQSALQTDNARPETHYNLGAALARLDRTTEAVDHYRRAIALRPTYAKARFNLANLLARAKQYDEAAKQFREVISLKPNFIPAYKNLSAVYRRQQDWSKAVHVLQDGLLAAPESEPILNDLFLLLTGVDSETVQDWPQAMNVATQYVRSAPRSKQAILMLAFAQVMSKQPQEAMATISRTMLQDAPSRECTLVVAMAQMQLGETTAAAKSFQQGMPGQKPREPQRLLRAIRNEAAQAFDAPR